MAVQVITDYRTIQVWPSGRGYAYTGDPLDGPCFIIRKNTSCGGAMGDPHTPTDDERAEISAELRAERYLEREVYRCESSLVDDLLKCGDELPVSGGLGDAWTHDNVANLYPDPSEWNAEQCREWLVDDGRQHDAGSLDELRNEIRESEPAEIYEWWSVSEWLAQELTAIGQPVLDNSYGYWWGRTCTGQGVLMDGTLQAIARKCA